MRRRDEPEKGAQLFLIIFPHLPKLLFLPGSQILSPQKIMSSYICSNMQNQKSSSHFVTAEQ